MPTPHTAHLDSSQLEAFALGRLSGEEAAAAEEHLSTWRRVQRGAG
jgi:hypothetical protein